MSSLRLDGPRLPPASGGQARQLVVFLHGYGADGNDLIGLGREWAKVLPNAAFVSPHAPEPCGMAPMGLQWFDLTFRDPGEMARGVARAGPGLDAFLSAELERLRLPSKALALVGFSQGTMIALAVGLKRTPPPAAIVGYSGALADVEVQPERPGAGPAILLVHGDMDEVIPLDAMLIAREQLAQAGLPVEWHVAEGLGHGIDPTGLKLGGAFLRQAFAAAATTTAPKDAR
jgi:phospholipase/carboxylesterase